MAQNRARAFEDEEVRTMLRRLLRLVVVGWIVSMIVGSIAALSLKRRLVPTTDESADEIVAVAIFAPLAFHSTAKAFRGGALECWYGGGVLDLRDAVLAPEGATLTVRAIFGGGQILVPADWKVVPRVRGMGGIQDVRPAREHDAIEPELIIEGMVFAGGFAVTSELAEGEAQWLEGMKGKGGFKGWRDYKASMESRAATEAEATTEPNAESDATEEMAPAT
jgi:hypothetical protein